MEAKMKRSFWKVTLCLFVLLTLVVSTAAAASLEEKKQELRQKTSDTPEKLYQKQPSARRAIENSAG